MEGLFADSWTIIAGQLFIGVVLGFILGYSFYLIKTLVFFIVLQLILFALADMTQYVAISWDEIIHLWTGWTDFLFTDAEGGWEKIVSWLLGSLPVVLGIPVGFLFGNRFKRKEKTVK